MMEALRKFRIPHSPGAPLFFFTTRDELRTTDPLAHHVAGRQRPRRPTELASDTAIPICRPHFLICVNIDRWFGQRIFGCSSTNSVFESNKGDSQMSLYRVIRLIGSSQTSWEEAAKGALEEAAKSLEDLRVAEVEELDIRMKENKVVEYPAAFEHPFAIIQKSVRKPALDLSEIVRLI